MTDMYLQHSAPGGSTTPVLPVATSAPVPTNAAAASNRNCKLWHDVIDGDNCAQISADANIQLFIFYFLNPDVDTSCLDLQLGVSYCVQLVGDISTYPGYVATVPSRSYTRPPPSPTKS